MPYHKERFASFLRKEISDFLQANVPREDDIFMSVTKIFTRERSDKAEVFILIFPEKRAEETFRQIKRLERGARKYIASRSHRQFIPRIKFTLSGTEKEIQLEKLLEKVKNE